VAVKKGVVMRDKPTCCRP